jgi:hypothetical protein
MTMYSQVATAPRAVLESGAEIIPVATLKDGYGGVAHFWIDDHCYVLGLERLREMDGAAQVVVNPTHHIFPEAFQVLKTLPPLHK